MDAADYEVAFQIISIAGSAKSSVMLALQEAREGNFEQARTLLAEADTELHNAHNAQTSMLSQEAGGNPVPVNIILVHAQDHLTGAMLVRDLANEFVTLYERAATTTA